MTSISKRLEGAIKTASELGLYVRTDMHPAFLLKEFPDLSLYWLEGISHAIPFLLNRDAKSLFIVTLPCHHTAKTFTDCITALGIVNPSLSPDQFLIFCNGRDEVASAIESGFRNTILCNHSYCLDETLYQILDSPETARCYDMIINIWPETWKRPYLSSNIERRALIQGYNFRKDDFFDVESVHPSYINAPKLTPIEVARVLNQSWTGGIFSAQEGGCSSSSEYLLCGLPVVSTLSKGGRDSYYTDYNSIIVEPSPHLVRKASDSLIQRTAMDPEIRVCIRNAHIETTGQYRKAAYQLIETTLESYGTKASASTIISKNYQNKMTRYTRIDSPELEGAA